MTRTAAVALLALTALLLGGCATMTAPAVDSRLTEYQAEAESLADEVVAAIPAELIATDARTDSEVRFGDTASGDRQPSDPAWWQVRRGIDLVAQPDASADAAEAIAAALTEDGWNAERVRETDGTRFTEGYRPTGEDAGEWYVEVVWNATQAGRVELIDILVVSPTTVRGDNDSPR